MDQSDLARIVDAAVGVWRRGGSREEYWDVFHEAVGVGSAAAALTFGMLASGDPAVRATGCDLAAAACNADEGSHAWAAEALVDLAWRETDVAVLRSLAGALEHVADPMSVPVLMMLASHDDRKVRFCVALALPAAMRDGVDEAGVETLIQLCCDVDAEIRNWATFGLGRQVETDGPAVRDALWARVDDDDPDVREEGICGLARRRERAMVPLVAELLRSGHVHTWLFDAAASLGDETLLAALDGYEPADVEEARRECDPVRRRSRDDASADLLAAVQTALDAQCPGLAAALFCDRWDIATPYLYVSDNIERVWFVESLLESVGGDPRAAAARVIAHVSGLPEG